MVFRRYYAKKPRSEIGFAITAGFALHQNKFNVIFYYRIRFIGFAEKIIPIGDFIGGIGNFMPNNRGKIVKTNLSTTFLYRSMKWNNGMAPFIIFSRKANIPHDANQSSARARELDNKVSKLYPTA